jgi:hypothetical protein
MSYSTIGRIANWFWCKFATWGLISQTPATARINVWILWESPWQIFQIEVPPNGNVLSLTQAIRNEKRRLQKYDVEDLSLWKVSIPQAANVMEVTLSNLRDPQEVGRRLNPLSLLSQVFTDDIDASGLQIIVQPPGRCPTLSGHTLVNAGTAVSAPGAVRPTIYCECRCRMQRSRISESTLQVDGADVE